MYATSRFRNRRCFDTFIAGGELRSRRLREGSSLTGSLAHNSVTLGTVFCNCRVHSPPTRRKLTRNLSDASSASKGATSLAFILAFISRPASSATFGDCGLGDEMSCKSVPGSHISALSTTENEILHTQMKTDSRTGAAAVRYRLVVDVRRQQVIRESVHFALTHLADVGRMIFHSLR
jgi:hypothetical protein